ARSERVILGGELLQNAFRAPAWSVWCRREKLSSTFLETPARREMSSMPIRSPLTIELVSDISMLGCVSSQNEFPFSRMVGNLSPTMLSSRSSCELVLARTAQLEYGPSQSSR